MLKSLVKALGLVAGLALSGTVTAVGMGGINVTTALGEPLKAEVELVAVGKTERSSLSAHLAAPDVFKGAGMEYPFGLPPFTFQIKTRANGEPYIIVTSEQPLNEPFVSLLVELTWSSGRLLREYTFLLDPPGFKAEQPKAAEVKPVLSTAEGQLDAGAAAAPESKAEAMKSESKSVRATAPVEGKTAAAKKHAEGGNVASGEIRVKRGDTLSKIALQAKSADISLERMLLALYRANADVFDGKNMNRLKSGKILRMPQEADLKVAQAEAVKEIHVQTAEWHAYRQKLAAASSAVAEQAPKQETSGKISAKVADIAPLAKETSKEVVRLSKGEAPGDKAATGGKAVTAQDKQHAVEEEAIAKNKALKESKERVAMLEKNVQAMQRLVELKSQLAAQSKPVLSKVEGPVPSKVELAKVEVKPQSAVAAVAVSQPSAAPVVAATSAVAPASGVTSAKPAAKPIAKSNKAAPPPPSMLDEVLSEPLYLAGGAAVLLGLGGLALARRRAGKQTGGNVVEDVDSSGARISAPVAPSPETGDFTKAVAAAPTGQSQTNDVDPISEADLFLNFGRDVQAEEILKDALKKNPDNQRIRLKLLSIYAKRKDVTTFAAVARDVQESGDAAAWTQAAEMGRKLEPNNPMYGDVQGEASASVPPDEVQGELPAADLDFDLGNVAEEVAAPAVEDFDSTVVLSAPLAEKAAAVSELDFDLGMDAPVETAAGVTGHVNTIVLDEPLGEVAAADADLDFDLGMDVPEEAAPAIAVAGDEGTGHESADYESTMVLDRPVSEMSATIPVEELQATPESPLDLDIPAQQVQAEAPASNLDDLIFDVNASHPSLVAMTEEKRGGAVAEGADDSLAFTLDFPVADTPLVADNSLAAPAHAADVINLSDINLNLDMESAAAPSAETKNAHWHDVATKLDLARAYQEMGDTAGAREILDEVMQDGDEQQRAAAEAMLQQLLA